MFAADVLILLEAAMDPVTALILLLVVGFATLGGAVVGTILGWALYILFLITAFLVATIACIVGAIGDCIYDRKVSRGEIPYRLPFYYRWKGWRIGYDRENSHKFKNGWTYNPHKKILVPMVRPILDYERSS